MRRNMWRMVLVFSVALFVPTGTDGLATRAEDVGGTGDVSTVPSVVSEASPETNSSLQTDAQSPEMDETSSELDEGTLSKPNSVEGTPQLMVCSTRGKKASWFLRDDDGYLRKVEDGSSLLQTEPTTPLVVLVHGNQASFQRAVEMGGDLWNFLVRQEVGAFRVLVWSWNSDRACVPVQMDSRIKASRADAQGALLAELIQSLPSETPVVLIGYSFGCRTVGGAAQLCGGGAFI